MKLLKSFPIIFCLCFSFSVLALDTKYFPRASQEFYESTCSLYREKGISDPKVKDQFMIQSFTNYHSLKAETNGLWFLADLGVFFALGGVYHVWNLNEQRVMTPFLRSFLNFSGVIISPYVISNLFSDRIKKKSGDFIEYAKSQIGWNDQTTYNPFINLDTLRLRYECVQNTLPQYAVDYFEKVFNLGVTYFFTSTLEEIDYKKDNFRKFESAVNSALSLPFQTKKIELNKELSQKIQEVLKEYEPSIQEEMVKKTLELALNSSEGSFSSKKPTIYFLGEAGTGKTYLAKEYAKSLGLLLVEIPVGKELEQGSENYRNSYGSSDFINKLAYYEKPGIITSSIIKAITENPGVPFSNMIFFIDEVDKALNSSGMFSSGASEMLTRTLLKMLDPETKTFALEELGIEIDISSSLFILAGNKPLKNKALSTRMKTLVFPPFALEKKRSIVLNYFEKSTKDKGVKFGTSELAFVNRMINEDPNPGVRALLLTVNDYINHLLLIAAKSEYFEWLETKDEFDFKKSLRSFSNQQQDVESSQDDSSESEDGEKKETSFDIITMNFVKLIENPQVFDSILEEQIYLDLLGDEKSIEQISAMANSTLFTLNHQIDTGVMPKEAEILKIVDDEEDAESVKLLSKKIISYLKNPIAFNATAVDEAFTAIEENADLALFMQSFAKVLYDNCVLHSNGSNRTLTEIYEKLKAAN